MDRWVEKACEIGAAQSGLVTTGQLLDLGASKKVIARLVQLGWLRRRHRGVCAFAGAPATWDQRVHAAALGAGERAAVSHSCAAKAWEFRHLPYLMCEVSVPRDRRVEFPGVMMHHVVLEPDDVAIRGGMPVTTFERTLVDCTTVLSRFQLLSNLDDGLRRNVASVRRLGECVERLESGPGRRLSMMRWVLEQRPLGYKPGGSHVERRVLDVLVAAGLPAPVLQHRVVVGAKTYYLDFAYPDHKVFIEYYGLAWHGTPSAVAYDSRRVSDLSTQGWLPLLFTNHTADRVIVEQTAAALARHTGF
jgi:very-short-patch-repair endonuclease